MYGDPWEFLVALHWNVALHISCRALIQAGYAEPYFQHCTTEVSASVYVHATALLCHDQQAVQHCRAFSIGCGASAYLKSL